MSAPLNFVIRRPAYLGPIYVQTLIHHGHFNWTRRTLGFRENQGWFGRYLGSLNIAQRGDGGGAELSPFRPAFRLAAELYNAL